MEGGRKLGVEGGGLVGRRRGEGEGDVGGDGRKWGKR